VRFTSSIVIFISKKILNDHHLPLNLYPDKFEAYSAGTHPTSVNLLAIQVMQEINIDIGQSKSKSVNEFVNDYFDYVVTVCDDAKEECPIFPNAKIKLHQSFEDPSTFDGSEEEKLNKFREIRDELKEFIIKLLKI